VAVNHLLRNISMWKSFAKESFPNGNHFGKKGLERKMICGGNKFDG